MSLLETAGKVARLSSTVRSTTTRVVLGCTAGAWVALSVRWPGAGEAGGGSGGGHADHHPSAALDSAAKVVDPWSLAWMGTWLLMVVAMMWPLTVPTVAAVSRSAFRGWRVGLGVVCLTTVTLLWLAFGVGGAMVARMLAVPRGGFWWQLSFLCLAMVSSRSARRSRVLERCLRVPPLAPGGRRGVVTAVRAGVLTWRRCALLCGPLMLAMTVGHSPVLMVNASLVAWWEAWHPRAYRDPVPVLLVAVTGAWVAVTALLKGRVGYG